MTKKKAWEWVMKVTMTDPGALEVHYTDGGDPLKPWMPEFGQMMVSVHVGTTAGAG